MRDSNKHETSLLSSDGHISRVCTFREMGDVCKVWHLLFDFMVLKTMPVVVELV